MSKWYHRTQGRQMARLARVVDELLKIHHDNQGSDLTAHLIHLARDEMKHRSEVQRQFDDGEVPVAPTLVFCETKT